MTGVRHTEGFDAQLLLWKSISLKREMHNSRDEGVSYSLNKESYVVTK